MELTLKILRELRGITQKEIADKINLTQGTIAYLEKKDIQKSSTIEKYLKGLEYEYKTDIDLDEAIANMDFIISSAEGINYYINDLDQKGLILNKNLKNVRICANLSQRELAKKIGIHQPTLNLYENGTRLCPGKIVLKIFEACDIKIDENYYLPENLMIDGTQDIVKHFKETPEFSSKQNEIALKYRENLYTRFLKLSQINQKELLNYLEYLEAKEKK